MKEKLDQKLCQVYPSIFCNRNKPPTETCMYWGFSCGDGWYDIINDLCNLLSFIEKQSGIGVIAEQVKEKFGTLRFYYSLKKSDTKNVQQSEWSDIIDSLVSYATMRSGWVCEICGSQWEVETKCFPDGYWIKTLCSDCRKKETKGEVENA